MEHEDGNALDDEDERRGVCHGRGLRLQLDETERPGDCEADEDEEAATEPSPETRNSAN